jgi:hypothetical protein
MWVTCRDVILAEWMQAVHSGISIRAVLLSMHLISSSRANAVASYTVDQLNEHKDVPSALKIKVGTYNFLKAKDSAVKLHAECNICRDP